MNRNFTHLTVELRKLRRNLQKLLSGGYVPLIIARGGQTLKDQHRLPFIEEIINPLRFDFNSLMLDIQIRSRFHRFFISFPILGLKCKN